MNYKNGHFTEYEGNAAPKDFGQTLATESIFSSFLRVLTFNQSSISVVKYPKKLTSNLYYELRMLMWLADWAWRQSTIFTMGIHAISFIQSWCHICICN